MPFHAGVAAASSGNKLGFIDKSGKWVIQPQFLASLDSGEDICGQFKENLCWVRNTDDRIGFIDRTGKVIVPFKFDAAWDYSNGLALVWMGAQCGYIDTSGKFVWASK